VDSHVAPLHIEPPITATPSDRPTLPTGASRGVGSKEGEGGREIYVVMLNLIQHPSKKIFASQTLLDGSRIKFGMTVIKNPAGEGWVFLF
jgi:hypothetical protein